MRASIKKAAPAAEETISYGFPAFRLNGKLLACFRGARAHCSYHPMSGRIVAANRAALSGYDTSNGTIRFPIGKPLPAADRGGSPEMAGGEDAGGEDRRCESPLTWNFDRSKLSGAT